MNVEELRDLYERATPGEWTRLGNVGKPDVVLVGAYEWRTGSPMNDDQPVRDARLIVAMHEALPELLAMLEARL